MIISNYNESIKNKKLNLNKIVKRNDIIETLDFKNQPSE